MLIDHLFHKLTTLTKFHYKRIQLTIFTRATEKNKIDGFKFPNVKCQMEKRRENLNALVFFRAKVIKPPSPPNRHRKTQDVCY